MRLFLLDRRWLFCMFNLIGGDHLIHFVNKMIQISISQYVPSMQLWSCSSCISRPPLQLCERSSAKWISCTCLRDRVFQRSHFSCRGNILVTGSTTSVVIGLTWGGVRYPWSSARVLLPLICGLIGLCVFVVYEIYFCKPPVVSPFVSTRQASADTFQGSHCAAHELDGRKWIHPELPDGRGVGNLKLYVRGSQRASVADSHMTHYQTGTRPSSKHARTNLLRRPASTFLGYRTVSAWLQSWQASRSRRRANIWFRYTSAGLSPLSALGS